MSNGTSLYHSYNTSAEMASGEEMGITQLPTRSQFPPIGTAPAPLQELLSPSLSLEQILLNQLKPRVENKLILTPVCYQKLLCEARCHLEEQAPTSDALARGAELLAQEEALRAMLTIQRNLLIEA